MRSWPSAGITPVQQGATSSLYSSLDIPHFDGDPTSVLALNLLHAANRKADDTALALRGWLAARIAEEEALLDNGRKARAALARAESTLPNRPARDEDGLFCFWDETRFPGYAGKTLLILCDPAATSLLENALNVTQAPTAPPRSLMGCVCADDGCCW